MSRGGRPSPVRHPTGESPPDAAKRGFEPKAQPGLLNGQPEHLSSGFAEARLVARFAGKKILSFHAVGEMAFGAQIVRYQAGLSASHRARKRNRSDRCRPSRAK